MGQEGGEAVSLELVHAWEDSDFFVLEGAYVWAAVEGHADEWMAIAEVLAGDRPVVLFKRCAARRNGCGVELWSPRNAMGARDCVHVASNEALALAEQIREAVAEAVFSSWA